MMKKKYIIIGLAITLFLGLIYFAIHQHKKTLEKQVIEKTFDFPETVTVNNGTHYNVDTIILIVTNKIFNYDTIHVDIFYVTNHLLSNEFIIHAHIMKHLFMPHTYILYLNKKIPKHNIHEVIIHELIHLQQYETGDLQIINNGEYYIYKGVRNKMKDVSYYNREYEKDAFANTQRILIKYYDLIKY